MLILKLFTIAAIVQLIHQAAFFEEMDKLFNKHYPLYHLPKLLTCSLCQTWWLCLLYIIVTGEISLYGILLCLISAHSVGVIEELYFLIFGGVRKMISWMIEKLEI